MEKWRDAEADIVGPLTFVDGHRGVLNPGAKRVCVVQASTVFYDTPATIDKAERLVAEASSLGAQLVVFPEAFVGGYPRGAAFGAVVGSRSLQGREDFLKYYGSAVSVPGPEVDRLSAMAGKYKVHLVIGVVERAGSTLYCTILYFDLHGEYLGKHRKLMPTASERIIWGFGDGSTLPVFDTPVGRVGGLICWENRMPLLRTAMYGKGIEIYCAPTADFRPTWQASMTHIAIEGGCFVLSANQFCRRKDFPPAPEYALGGFGEVEPSLESVVCPGGSVILSPTGTVLAGPNFEGETLLIADIGTKSQLVVSYILSQGLTSSASIDLGVLIKSVSVVMGRFYVQSWSTWFDEFWKNDSMWCGCAIGLEIDYFQIFVSEKIFLR